MKKKSINKQKSAVRFAPMLPNAVALGLKEAERMVDQGEGYEALAKLSDLEFRYPGHLPVLQPLFAGAVAMEDTRALIVALEGLTQIDPSDPVMTASLFAAYGESGYPFLALKMGRTLVEISTASGDETAKSYMDQAALMEGELASLLDDEGFGSDADSFERAVMLDRARLRLAQHRFGLAHELCATILAGKPGFVPALNALSKASFYEGNLGGAIEAIESALKASPSDIALLSNAAHYYAVAGLAEKGQQIGETLKTVEIPDDVHAFRQIEGLLYLGDDEGALAAFYARYPPPDPAKTPWLLTIDPDGEGSESGVLDAEEEIDTDEEDETDPDDDFDTVAAFMHHYAAVAASRLGYAEEAAELWDAALALDSHLEIAEANLEDLDLPLEERNGAWPFPIQEWIPESVMDEIIERLTPILKKGRDLPSEDAIVREILLLHPELEAVAAPLLDRGDEVSRTFVLMLSDRTRSPKICEALRDFALGQRGPDAFRLLAARRSIERGLLPEGTVRMWLGEKWQEIEVP